MVRGDECHFHPSRIRKNRWGIKREWVYPLLLHFKFPVYEIGSGFCGEDRQQEHAETRGH